MSKIYATNVYSEYGKLKTVLVHRPAEELVNLTPNVMEKLLFDDIPDLKLAQFEHDEFVKILRQHQIEVLYIETLAIETITLKPELRPLFIQNFIKEANCETKYKKIVKNYLISLDHKNLIQKMIAGISKLELAIQDENNYPLLVDPLPNYLFQRDPFSVIGNGVTINHMFSPTRKRETLISEFVLKNHPRFQNQVNFWYDRNETARIEGGDILVLNQHNLMFGASQRTSMAAIQKCASRILNDESNQFTRIIAIELKTKNRAFMHLDTVFSCIDQNKFIAHSLIFNHQSQFKIYEITKNETKIIKKPLSEYLTSILEQPITLIKCGGDNPINQAREQWNDGNNVLAIAPGVVIAYARNQITNQLLRDNGITVYEIPAAELSRGRGGPRCMSMPIIRENI